MAEAREAVGTIIEEEEAAGAMVEVRARFRVGGVGGAVDGAVDVVVEIAVTYFFGSKYPSLTDIFQKSRSPYS